MDTAVALAQAYLQVNGYFTVAEYPVLEALRRGQTRTATDLDLLAFRFPGAGEQVRVRGKRRALGEVTYATDPALRAPKDRADMIVGEVKEGAAGFNPAARDPLVLSAALSRFGCCGSNDGSLVVEKLLHRGRAVTPSGHSVRMVAFGSSGSRGGKRHLVITTSQMLLFLREHLRHHWKHLGRTQLSQPALSFLALMEKADRSSRAARPPRSTR